MLILNIQSSTILGCRVCYRVVYVPHFSLNLLVYLRIVDNNLLIGWHKLSFMFLNGTGKHKYIKLSCFNLILFYFIILCVWIVCLYVCLCMTCACPWRSEKEVRSLGIGVRDGSESLFSAVIQPGSSRRATSALNCLDISPVPTQSIFISKKIYVWLDIISL